MNPLQRAVIEKVGNEYGFENILPDEREAVCLGSARHRAKVCIAWQSDLFEVAFSSAVAGQLSAELARSFPSVERKGTTFMADSLDDLAQLLRRAAALAKALPNQVAVDFETLVNKELEQFPSTLTQATEVERLVRQRVGQQAFRQAMLDYWGGACAVTGVALPDVLRASHAKPWAECVSDAERLDVFNGFLLNANLDALFDRFLITFSDDGELVVSSSIADPTRELLGLNRLMHLRWIAQEHLPYLQFHRDRFFVSNNLS
jgi:hypothetical protein